MKDYFNEFNKIETELNNLNKNFEEKLKINESKLKEINKNFIKLYGELQDNAIMQELKKEKNFSEKLKPYLTKQNALIAAGLGLSAVTILKYNRYKNRMKKADKKNSASFGHFLKEGFNSYSNSVKNFFRAK